MSTEWDWLGEPEAKAMLAARGVSVPRNRVVSTPAAAVAAAGELSSPIVVKIVADGVVHKSDVGGVRLGLTDAAEVAAAASDLLRLSPADDGSVRLLVEEQGAGVVEVAIGARSTQGFGPVVMVGLGGVWIEHLADVAFGFAPLAEGEATDLLRTLKGWPLLSGGRGRPAADVAALARTICAVGDLAVELSAGRFQIDVNPVLVGPDGALAVDAAIATSPPPPDEPVGSVDVPIPVVELRRLFHPAVAAVAGVDPRRPNNGNRMLQEYARAGRTARVAIHPDAETLGEISGAPAVRTVNAVAGLELLSITGPDGPVESLLAEAPAGTAVHLFAGPFTPDDAYRNRWKAHIRTVAWSSGVRFLGPNAMGIHCPSGGLSFVPGSTLRTDGRVSAVLQSGGLAADLVALGEERGIGFASVVSAGDAYDIGVDELFAYLLDDPATDVIGLYVETARSARGILDAALAARTAGRGKPVVLLLGGTTPRGAAAAASHTGALAEDSRLWLALADRIGAVIAESLEDFVTVLRYLELFGRRSSAGSATLLIGTGGDGVIGADQLTRHGLDLPGLTRAARFALDALALPGIGRANPVDLVSAGAILSQRSGDMVLDAVVGAALNNQEFSDVVLQLGATSLFLYFPSPDELLDRIVASAARLTTRHPDVRFSVVVQAVGRSEAAGRRALSRLAEAGYATATAMRDVGVGLSAVQRAARRADSALPRSVS